MPAEARALELPTGDDAFQVTICEPDRVGVPVPTQRTYAYASAFNFYPASTATGFGTIRTAQGRSPDFRLRDSLPLIELAVPATGYGWLGHLMTRCLLFVADPRDLHETGSRILVFTDKWYAAPSVDTQPAPDALPSSPEADAARRLRELSGLKPAKLATLFGVSRKAFYDWLDGALPRGTAREHLLEATKLIEEASTRFAGPRDLSSWLLTPVSPGGRTPFHLLKERRAALFRGFSLRGRGSEVQPPLIQARADLGPTAVSDGLARAARRPAMDDVPEFDFGDSEDAL